MGALAYQDKRQAGQDAAVGQRKGHGVLADNRGGAAGRVLPDNRGAVQRVEAVPNKTGLPDGLKAGVEGLSGMSLDHVRVHYNSEKPAQLNAHAYAQGADIHLGAGQEKHLPHEAWHVVQQMQGRVRPTMQMRGVGVNGDGGLEREADLMGQKALSGGALTGRAATGEPTHARAYGLVMQKKIPDDLINGNTATLIAGEHHEELDSQKEVNVWDGLGINVKFEDEGVGEQKIRPDPTELRIAYNWAYYYRAANKFWSEVATGIDASDAEAELIRSEPRLEIMICDLAVLPEENWLLAEAADRLEALHNLMPTCVPGAKEQTSAERVSAGLSWVRFLSKTNMIVKEGHQSGEYNDTRFNGDDLRVARSRWMLATINEIAPPMTIYKVGNRHVEDMIANKWERAPKVEILDRKPYKLIFQHLL